MLEKTSIYLKQINKIFTLSVKKMARVCVCLCLSVC